VSSRLPLGGAPVLSAWYMIMNTPSSTARRYICGAEDKGYTNVGVREAGRCQKTGGLGWTVLAWQHLLMIPASTHVPGLP
jgi:hypothetical protein